MKLTERDKQVLDAFARGCRYQEAANELKLDKNQIYSSVVRLTKFGLIEKVATGQYQAINGVVPVVVKPNKPSKKTKAPVVVELPQPKKDIEELAAKLVDKVSELAPMLALHKDLFNSIQDIALELVEKTLQERQFKLSKVEYDEYQDLLKLKRKAQEIVKQKFPQSTRSMERVR